MHKRSYRQKILFIPFQVSCHGLGNQQVCQEAGPAELRAQQRAAGLLVSSSGRRVDAGLEGAEAAGGGGAALIADKVKIILNSFFLRH